MSYVARKPEPLGAEFKNLVDGLSGEMMWLEVQEGKDRMKKKPYQNLGGTAACVMRGVKESCDFLIYYQIIMMTPHQITHQGYILATAGSDRSKQE